MADSGLQLRPLRADQYRQVAEWEWGKQEDADWPRYYAEMNAPQWRHLAVYRDSSFIGCISLEINRTTVAYHVATARRAIRPPDLAGMLLRMAGDLFSRGFTSMVAIIPKEKRAATRLALRCGMFEFGHTLSDRRFILTQSRFQRLNSGQFKT